MGRFKRLSQVIWHCQCHIIWLPKYRFRVLKGTVAKLYPDVLRAAWRCEIAELNYGPIMDIYLCL